MIRLLFNSLHDRWANLHSFVRLLLVLLFVAVAGFGIVRPALSGVRQWRVDRNLSAASAAVDATRMAEARDLALSVLQTGDPRIDALRIFEASTASLRDPRHAQAARALITHPDGTIDDRLTGFRGIVDQAPLGLLGQVWVALPAPCRTDSRFALAFADRLIAENCFTEAADSLVGLPESAIDEAVNLRLIRILIGTRKPKALDEAARLIVAGFPAQKSPASPWLDLLETLPSPALNHPSFQPLRAKLASRSGPEHDRCQLLLVRMDYATDWQNRSQIVDAAVARWESQNPVLLARCLDQLGLHQRLAAVFPPPSLADHPELLPLLIRAATYNGQWETLGNLLDQQPNILPLHEELAHRAVILAKTDTQTKPAADAWNAALAQATTSPDPAAPLDLHRIASAASLPDQADLAMLEAIRSDRSPLPLYRELKPTLGRWVAREREHLLMQVCATYLLYEPANPVLLTQYAYLACLNNLIIPSEILRAMEPMAAAFPGEWPMQLVIATAHLAAGNPTAARQVLANLPLDPQSLAPGYRAIFLATEVLTGKRPANDPAITQFPRNNLLPSERRRFNEWTRPPAD